MHAATNQQLIPVIRQSPAPPHSISIWKSFLKVSEFNRCSYVSLAQVAVLFDGHLHWHPVAKNVDLLLHGDVVRFFYGASPAFINGRRFRLERPTVQNDEGFWVPVSFFAQPEFYRVTHIKLKWPPTAKPVAPVAAKSKPKAPTPLPSKPAPVASPEPIPPIVAPKPAVPETTARSAKAVRRIVIDPGHGGKDPGTVSARGIEEKRINLILAQELSDALREKEDYEVLMTRTDDSFIPLEERAQLANRHNADLFISLHCNASLSTRMKGFEVYFLSENASDPHADAVARLENSPLALEGKTPSPREVAAVLRSLVKTAYINESSSLGALIARAAAQRLSEPSLGVKQAGFYVLRGAEMPAVLVEAGFLSNVKEAKLLQKASFRQRLIESLVTGIRVYDERKRQERR
jgi:N-acetylmuramoyl-L-alanine amidase